MSIENSVNNLPKIMPNVAKQLKALGIITIADLLQYYPKRYLDFSKFTYIKDARTGETVTLKVKIKSISAKIVWVTRRAMAEAVVSDETGSLKVTWFNQGYMAKALRPGDEIFLSGKIEQYKGLRLINPIQEKVSEHNLHTGRLVPIYKLPDTLYSRTFRTLVDTAMPLADQLTDIIPLNIRALHHLPTASQTVRELHFPTSKDAVTKSQERLAFEEALVQQLAVQQHKLELKKNAAPNIDPNIEQIKSLINKLPFTLTTGQKRSLWDICKDLRAKYPMNRLLMGDVGSGKTIVALLAALQIIEKGFQVVLLAPTEVLAKQHYDGILKQIANFKSQIEDLNLRSVALLTKTFHLVNGEPINKTKLIQRIAQNEAHLIIGTHALLQEKVKFKNLAFVVIDEQHRLGVNQRGALLRRMDKLDDNTKWVPHLLSMTATPIPRTAALTLYGDLDISIIDELPKNRLPIKTWIVPESKRDGAYEFIKKELRAGRQTFIITPLVEESDKLQTKSAKAEYERLQKSMFNEFKLGLVYGSMKGKDKDMAMREFKNKDTDILVATSVVEIGIDIPNASIMMIEGSERFGLAQLHQLRGRVGRGEYQSYCLLFTTNDGNKDNMVSQEGDFTTLEQPHDNSTGLSHPNQSITAHNDANDRLTFFSKTTDGFKLADYDMKTRGFGSLFGTEQTGFAFKYGQYLTLKVLEKAKLAAQKLINENPDMSKHPDLAKLSTPLSQELHLE